MRRTLVLTTLATLLAVGCKEPFPVYEEPTNVLVASIAGTGSDTLYIVQDSAGQTIGMDPIGLLVDVQNNYSQLLQGAAQVTGRLNVVMTAPAGYVFPTRELTQSDLIRPPVYMNTVALPPGQSAQFRATTTAYGLVSTLMNSVPYSEEIQADSTRVLTYAPVTLQAEAEVRIFERVQPITTDRFFFTKTYIQIILHKAQ